MRPYCDIPHTLNGLAKDLKKETGYSIDDIYREAIARGLVDVARELEEKGEINPEFIEQLEGITNGL